MGVQVSRNDAINLSVLIMSGALVADEIISSIADAVDDGQLKTTDDRMTIISPGCDVSRMTLNEYRHMKALAMPALGPAGSGKTRHAIVVGERSARLAAEMYRALWDNDPASPVEIAVFDTERQALDWLGRNPGDFLGRPLKSA